MSWKSRRRKKFFRNIRSLEEAEMFLVDQYIVINEYVASIKDYDYSAYEFKKGVKDQYEEYLASGKIKSFLDFDSYFNPDLTLLINYEPDEKKADSIAKKLLLQIGSRWEERLKELFPEYEYTLVMYFDCVESEWFLDFYNGIHQIKDPKDPERMKYIFYFNNSKRVQ